MKTNEAPEKIYITPHFERRWFTKEIDDVSIEYTCTDAFIEKARKWFEMQNEGVDSDGNYKCDMKDFEDFIKYMKG